MDNAQKAIMIGVGLFITIIVIAAVMLITGMGQDLLNSGVDEVNNISSNLKAQLTSEFDGNTNLSGSQVIAAIKKYYTNKDLLIIQETGRNYSVNASKAVGTYTGGTPPYSTTQAAIGQVSSNVRIAETYSSKLIYSGKTVVGMQFTLNP